jgi:hypothetical protein
VAENNQVEPKMVRSRKAEGYGLDAVWHDLVLLLMQRF